MAMVDEGMREEKFEISNAYNLIRNFAKRGTKKRAVRCKESFLKMREITIHIFIRII